MSLSTSLTEIWNAAAGACKTAQFKLACWGVYEPEGVRQELLKRGWQFEVQILPFAPSASGMHTIQAVQTIKTPEGVSTLIDDDARARYNEAHLQAVKKVFAMP